MIELEIGLNDRGELNFDRFFFYFNVKICICPELLQKKNLNLTE